MSFTIPQMPLTCGIYTPPWSASLLRLTTACNLAYGQRALGIPQDGANVSVTVGQCVMQLLLPALTDVRSGVVAAVPDFVEVPAGSGRWYQVYAVDDIGKGFANEHRIAVILAVSALVNPTAYAGIVWPVPIP